MIATCTVTGGVCRFTTDSFSYFAIGNPISSSSSSPSGGGDGSSSSSSGPGGLGGGVSTYPVLQPVDRVYTLTSSGVVFTYSTLTHLDSLREFARQEITAHPDTTKNIVDPIVTTIENSQLSRTDKNIMYLRASFAITREIVSLPRGSIERTSLIAARQAILSKRKSLIQSLFSR